MQRETVESVANRLNIFVVGAGIGGLATALGLRRNGHRVTVFEQSVSAAELGAAVILAPNAHGIIKRLCIDAEKDGAIVRQWHTEYTAAGQLLVRQDLSTTAGLWQHTGILCRRYEIHNALKSAAVAAEGPGPPIHLRTSCRVASVVPDSATLIFEDGSSLTGDLTIGADGIKSVTRSSLHHVKPFPSGKSAYRFLVDRDKALNSPDLGDIVQRDGEFSIWYGADRRVWLYTTHFNRLLNFVCMHPDSLSETSNGDDAFGNSNNVHNNKSRMMEIFQDFDPRLVSLLDMAEPSSVRLWQLLDMEPPPRRQHGRLGLVGDAALPFLPHIGQGAACALEDAASITTLFGPEVQSSDVPERLRLYEECRKTRAEEIQSFSRLLGRDLESGNEDAKLNRELMLKKYFPYIFAHDEFDHSAQRLREHKYRKTCGLWSMPTSFGPVPRLHHTASEPNIGGSSYMSSTVKFKTSMTLLQNLLPKSRLTFTSPGSVALASVTHIQYSDLAWLGGQSFNELTFYIHSVRDREHRNKSALGSALLLVSFVDSPDILARRRENPGIPTLFCSFKTLSLGNRREIIASWNARTIFKMGFKILDNEAMASEPDCESTVLTHRYIPGIDIGSRPAADSIICLSMKGSDRPNPTRRKPCSDSELKFIAHSSRELPTLHYILERLAELPILDFAESYVVEGTGSLEFDRAWEL